MLGKQLIPICKCMFGSTTAGIQGGVVRSTPEKTHELIKETVRQRKKYYSGSSWQTVEFRSLKFGKYTPPPGAFLPVRLPFRYLEEIIMTLALVRDCVFRNREKAFIVYPVVRRSMDNLQVNMRYGDELPKHLYSPFFDGIKRFDEKQLTKFAYVLYDMGEDVVKKFLKKLFALLEESRITASLFALSYKYLMVDEREELVSAYRAIRDEDRKYKFRFDTFYMSAEEFLKVLQYKQPKKQNLPSSIKLQAVRLIQKAYRKRLGTKRH